jgi:type IV pilus assembly protein PilP
MIGVAGCGNDKNDIPPVTPKGANGAVATQPPAAAPAASGTAKAIDPLAGLPPLPLREFQEKEFSESEESRDPFRSYSSVFTEQAKIHSVNQRKVLAERFALDELKLIGIVTRGGPYALLMDADSHPLGYVARPGDFVGKAEIVHSGGPTGNDVAINWRVDRIREGDVVFVREDPSHPEIPPTHHVVALRTPDEEAGLVHKNQ